MEKAMEARPWASAEAGPGMSGRDSAEAPKLFEDAMPHFTHYRRRKTNKAPRKRTFIMHMTKTPELLSRTLGVQRAAGGGGGGGKKRHRTSLKGSTSFESGGSTQGAGDANEEGGPVAAFPSRFEASSPANTQARAVSASPFGAFAAASAVAAQLPAASYVSPFASAFAADFSAFEGVMAAMVDPLADDFIVPCKPELDAGTQPSGPQSLSSNNVYELADEEAVDGPWMLFSSEANDEDGLSRAAKRARYASPEPESAGPDVSLTHLIGSGAFGKVWRGNLNGVAVAVKTPLVRVLRTRSASRSTSSSAWLSRGSAGSTTSSDLLSGAVCPASPMYSSASASPADAEPRPLLRLGAVDTSDEGGLSPREVMAAFSNEVRALQAAGPHPHIVQALGARTVGANACLVMELAPWGSLADYLDARSGARDWAALEDIILARLAREYGVAGVDALVAAADAAVASSSAGLTGRRYLVALALVADAADGVAHLHATGLVHRDLKPDNILIDAAGRGRVSDLGLARRISVNGESAEQSADDAVVHQLTATPQYASPEDLRGEDVVAASDSYSLGSCLWQALTGAVPWEGLSAATVMYRVSRQMATLPLPEAWPQGVRGLLAASWAPLPADRPAVPGLAAQLKAELARVAQLA